MKNDAEIVYALDAVDWNFPGAQTGKRSVHSLHWYPGNFIPQIPSYLIHIFSRQNDLVFDPFCGSGTTGIEAIRLRRNALQSDANSVSVEISRAKLATKDRVTVIDALQRLSHQLVWESLVRSDALGSNEEGAAAELALWFDDDTLSQFRALWNEIEQVPGDARHCAELIFSDTLFACASTGGAKTRTGGLRRHHWGWIADNVRPRTPLQRNVIATYTERIMKAINVLRQSEPLPGVSFGVLQQDARCLALPDASVDLIVTSPPYLGMIDYAHANRLQYLWKGWPIKPDAQREIGARYRRYGVSEISSYLAAMTKAIAEISRVLKPSAYCAIVIGASSIYPHIAADVVQLFADRLRLVWGPVERHPSRQRVTARSNHKSFELVSVFRRVG